MVFPYFRLFLVFLPQYQFRETAKGSALFYLQTCMFYHCSLSNASSFPCGKQEGLLKKTEHENF